MPGGHEKNPLRRAGCDFRPGSIRVEVRGALSAVGLSSAVVRGDQYKSDFEQPTVGSTMARGKVTTMNPTPDGRRCNFEETCHLVGGDEPVVVGGWHV